ncbi:hypothetical protein CFK38_07405 [Brachybacterium vulturis]|uniref:Uncharacterized protein n=1 Tax=Brachybacterium vulturis TaxID=2017484 RepID=A0A291GMB5_9MICO|nr:hypothetical protein [Brachybacterium vulturis]ATG51371.1 hypothetical protein CFK38_07405 [Brachybacterium vulturis]
MKTTTLAAAFSFFSTYPDNPRWSWSAVSPDSKTVAVTIWEHEVGDDGSIDCFGDPGLTTWTSKPGNQERIRNLQIARDNCDALFHVIWVTARNLEENPWTIAGRYPEEHFMMKLIDLNEVTGEFSAVLVDPASAGHELRTMSDRPTKPPVYSLRIRTDRRRTSEATSRRAIATCPTCFMALPATGICDTCE